MKIAKLKILLNNGEVNMAKNKKRKGMKKGKRNVLRVIISIIYIVWGLWSPLSALTAIFALNISAIIAATVGVLTLLAGVMGLVGVKKNKCRVFGIIIFVFAVASVIFALPAISINSIINALLAWLFIACL